MTSPREAHRKVANSNRRVEERSAATSTGKNRDAGRVDRLSAPQLQFEAYLALAMSSSLLLGLWSSAQNRRPLDLVLSVIALTFTSLLAWRVRERFQGHRTQFFDWDRKPQAQAKTNFVAFGEEWPDRSVENAELRLMDRLHVGNLSGFARLVVGLLFGFGLVAVFTWWPISVKVFVVLCFWFIFRSFFLQQSLWLLLVSGSFALYFAPRDSEIGAWVFCFITLVFHATSFAAFAHLKRARWRDLQLTTDLAPQPGATFKSGVQFAALCAVLFWSAYEVDSRIREILSSRKKPDATQAQTPKPQPWQKRLAQSLAEEFVPEEFNRDLGDPSSIPDKASSQAATPSRPTQDGSPSLSPSFGANPQSAGSGQQGPGVQLPQMSAPDREQIQRTLQAVENFRAHAEQAQAQARASGRGQDLQIPGGGSDFEFPQSIGHAADLDRDLNRELDELRQLAAHNGLSPDEFAQLQKEAQAQAKTQAQKKWPPSAPESTTISQSSAAAPANSVKPGDGFKPSDMKLTEAQLHELRQLSQSMKAELTQTKTRMANARGESATSPNSSDLKQATNENSGSNSGSSLGSNSGANAGNSSSGHPSGTSRDPVGATRSGSRPAGAQPSAADPQSESQARAHAEAEKAREKAEHKRRVEFAQKSFELVIDVLLAVFKLALIIGALYLFLRVLRHFRKRGPAKPVRLIQLGQKDRDVLRARLKGLQRQKLRPDQEIIETYNLLLGAFDASASPRAESEPAEIFAVRIAQDGDAFSPIIPAFQQSTRTFSRTLFGEIEVPGSELQRFRENSARVFQFFEIVDSASSLPPSAP